MYLSPARRSRHVVGALLILFLFSVPSTFAQTASTKTPNTSIPESIPVVQSQKSDTQKTETQKPETQTSIIKSSKNVRNKISVAGPVPAGPVPAGPAPAATSFTNATPITITDCPNPCPASGQAASLYPSPITVSGEVG